MFEYIQRLKLAVITLFKWLFCSVVCGCFIGSVGAVFHLMLGYVGSLRVEYPFLLFGLPVAGIIIVFMYNIVHEAGNRGTNLVITAIQSNDEVPGRVAPLILVSTLLTHLCGGSAGREGTGVQMGGAIADQFSRLFRMRRRDHRLMVAIGISAGFASVFGTPLAGAVFGLEVIVVGRMRYEAILPSFLSAAVASMVCHAWGVEHTHYVVSEVPFPDASNLLWTIGAGILFGLAAMLFSRSIGFWSGMAKRISYPPFRPLIGGLVIAAAVWMMGTTKYIGLGVPTIVASFTEQQMWYDFLLKILFTTFTIGVGFKGGEVTPLFFVGATLGSALSAVVPLPMGLLAGIGFVAVFAGATNTPIACTLMGIELFGAEPGLYLGIACVVAYLFSGHTGIYTAQLIGSPKHLAYSRRKGKTLAE